MQLHIDEISTRLAEGAHAVLLLDRAGWHTTSNLDGPENITPIFLPSRAPQLNPVENVWQYLRSNWLSNRVFENYDAIIDAACEAWMKLTAMPETVTSIGMRSWAHVGQESSPLVLPVRERYFVVELPAAWINPGPNGNGFVWDVAGSPNPQDGHFCQRRPQCGRRPDLHVGNDRDHHLGGDRQIRYQYLPGRTPCRSFASGAGCAGDFGSLQ